MEKISIVDMSGKAQGEHVLAESLSKLEINPALVKLSVDAFLAGLRQGTHKVKSRSEVAGSTRKLYKQKGTGNARAGSNRSPIRRHGGTIHGPVPHGYDKKVNKKEKRQAFYSVVKDCVLNDKIVLVDQLTLDNHKTKNVATFLSNWKAKSYLLVDVEFNPNVIMASSNLNYVKLSEVANLNTYDLLRYEKIIMTKDSMQKIEENLASKN